METFKLDLSKLTPVAEADRVKGNWYVVADEVRQYGSIRQWHSGNINVDWEDGGKDLEWNYWFAIPPGLPGFPEAELPDEFELKANEWEVQLEGDSERFVKTTSSKLFRIKPTKLPTISIPSGTKSEQVAELKRLLDLLS